MSLNNRTFQFIAASQAGTRHFHVTARQETSRSRRTDAQIIRFERFFAQHLDTRFSSVLHIFFKSSRKVRAKVVVVPHEQALHVQFIAQHEFHKFARRKHRHLLVEVQHHAAAQSRSFEQLQFFVVGGQQFGPVLCVRQCQSRMFFETDNDWRKAAFFSFGFNLFNQIQVSAVHPVEKTNGSAVTLGRVTLRMMMKFMKGVICHLR